MAEIFAKPEVEIELGRRGENLTRTVLFDFADWQREYGPGTVQLLHQRSGDEAPYPCAVAVDGTQIRWEIADADLAKVGRGRAELQYFVDEVIVKSQIYHTRTFRALDEAGPVPEAPQKTWVEQVLKAQVEAQRAADLAWAATEKGPVIQEGTWWVWDAETGSYKDTGVMTSADQADYAQNDPTHHGYIRNRPFYEDGSGVHPLEDRFLSLLQPRTPIDVVPQREVAFAYNESCDCYCGSWNAAVELTKGKTYTVEWDGTAVPCTAKLFDAIILAGWYLGNLSLMTQAAEDDTGEHFLFLSFPPDQTVWFLTKQESGTHTVRVSEEDAYRVRDSYLEGTGLADRVAALQQAVGDTAGNLTEQVAALTGVDQVLAKQDQALAQADAALGRRAEALEGRAETLEGRTEALEQQAAHLKDSGEDWVFELDDGSTVTKKVLMLHE